VTDITVRRWQEAQGAEMAYWEHNRTDPAEILRITLEKAEAVGWAMGKNYFSLDGSESWLEIGIGPLGVGCMHFMPDKVQRRVLLIGLDPIPPRSKDLPELCEPISALVRACHRSGYSHLVGIGENLPFAAGSVSFVICYNVLDHCHCPTRVIEEASRVLKTGGWFLLGCDVSSWVALAKWQLRRRAAAVLRIDLNSISDVAHPHRFLAKDLQKMCGAVGFSVRSINVRPFERFKRVWSHAHRMLLLAQKGPNA
jgi:SAM-dependent methyltransferase